MDYKELIERLEYYGTTYAVGDNLGREINGSDELMLTAATAIETLLAERDEAMKFIPKVCSTCKHWDAGGCNAPIADGECAFDLRQAWQWRVPQKEGDGDE